MRKAESTRTLKAWKWVAGQKPYDPQGKMKQPGFKILHCT